MFLDDITIHQQLNLKSSYKLKKNCLILKMQIEKDFDHLQKQKLPSSSAKWNPENLFCQESKCNCKFAGLI